MWEVLRASPEPHFVLSPTGVLLDLNPPAETLTGYSRDELVGRSLLEIGLVEPPEPPEARAAAKGLESTLLEGNASDRESTLVRKDGSPLPVLVRSYTIEVDTAVFVVGVVRDVSHRREIERSLEAYKDHLEKIVTERTAELAESEHRYRQFVENSPNAIFSLDRGGAVRSWNRACETSLGYASSEAIGQPLDTLLVADARGPDVETLLERVRGGNVLANVELAYRAADGSPRQMVSRLYPIVGRDGAVQGCVVANTDQTHRRRAEAELRASEERLRILFEHAPDAYFLSDPRGNVLDGNRAAEALTGYAREELIGSNFARILPPDQIPRAMELLRENLAGHATGPDELVLLRQDGSSVPVEVQTHPTLVRGEQVLLGMVRDISERKREEEERLRIESRLRHSQKMEAVGLLAGGVAHDMNNILGTIMGLVTIHLTEFGKEHPVGRDLAEIMKACRRGRELTVNLLGFARKGKRETAPFSVNDVVDEVASMLERTIPRTVSIERDLADGLWSVEGDAAQLTHALTNVGINANDAMSGRGRLRLITTNVTLDEELVAQPSGQQIPEGDYVRIAVEDTGTGMAPETLERIFEPFFTTKARGEGTGLGLSMVFGAVREHGGVVEVASSLGDGTTVAIYLPASESEPSERLSGAFLVADAVPEGITVLLVEDDGQLRKAMERQIRMLGCEVLVAANGAEALTVFREQMGRIDVVLLDLIMPEVDGEEAFHSIRRIAPEAKIIVLSGYSQDGTAQALIDAGAVCFLQKPVELPDLATAITEAHFLR